MRLIIELNPETRKLLNRINWQSKFPQVKDRAKCIILSYKGFAIKQLMVIFGVSRKTIYNWLTRWEKQQILGIYNQKGRGRKPKFSQSEKEQVKEWVKAEPKALKQVVIKIPDQWGIEVSKETIKRIIKKLNMRWKRMKRGISKTPDEWEIEVKLPRLAELKSQVLKGKIDLRYLDESGFSLMPYIP
jgi:transposase